MSSGRRFSVERHIKNIHGGNGKIIPFVEYLAGRRDGKFSYKNRSETYGRQNSLLKILLNEVDRDFARKVAAKVNKPADDSGYAQVAEILKVYKQDKFYKEIISEIKTGDFTF